MSVSIGYFLATIAITLVITIWAAQRSKGRASFYAASSRISGSQNGLALAGDFMSSTTILGVIGLYYLSGADTAIYFIAPPAGLCLILVLIAGPLRRLGRYTLGDVVQTRLRDPRMKLFAGVSTVVISLIYLVAQLVGAGLLISILFGIGFTASVLIVAVLMTTYVVFGGMLAATWVQIIKAGLLICAVVLLAALCLVKGGGLAPLYERAAALHKNGSGVFQFGGMQLGLFSALSLAFGLGLGLLGLPHLLIRFFTVPDEFAARKSLCVATTVIGFVFIGLFVIVGPATVAFVTNVAAYHTPDGGIVGGPNMVIVHLANAVGGDMLVGVVSAIAFATILAVVAGLTIAMASAISHDLAVTMRKGAPLSEGAELMVFRSAAFLTSAAAVILAILFQHENVAFLVALAFSVAASTTFPVLLLVLYWRGLTMPGALAGGLVGLVTSVVLIGVSPVFMVKVLGAAEPLFPSEFPGLVSAPLAFFTTWAVSLATQKHAQERELQLP
jgi:cation/acetate symporter